ncbi:MAG: winged helix-turn-helix transcriptional regulator [Clostridia bacterium]|nr:winged helix-turn-helix transcriptional regulator [Clostridia bacterium]
MDGRYERAAEFFAALGHPARLRILELLASEGRCACELNQEIGLDQSTISRHLLALKRAGILKTTKDGVRVIYRLADKRVLQLLELASEVIASSISEQLATFGRPSDTRS